MKAAEWTRYKVITVNIATGLLGVLDADTSTIIATTYLSVVAANLVKLLNDHDDEPPPF